MESGTHLRIMTYNIGGGRKSIIAGGLVDYYSNLGSVIEVVRKEKVDVLALQEATDYTDADGCTIGAIQRIAAECGFEHVFFQPTISMQKNLHVKKTVMREGIFNDWQDWRQGNALLSHVGFVRLGNPYKPGLPRFVPIHYPPIYQGDRDTEVRGMILARLDLPPVFPFIIVIHLSTLVAERGVSSSDTGVFKGVDLRQRQVQIILDLIQGELLEKRQVVFLLGDFNAMANESCIQDILVKKAGFVRLEPGSGKQKTHPMVEDAIDHILIYPQDRMLVKSCVLSSSLAVRDASDHIPVVAEVVLQ
jgi:endonuclease/exonuclease/phosphatase family metal-dependent hydrolase